MGNLLCCCNANANFESSEEFESDVFDYQPNTGQYQPQQYNKKAVQSHHEPQTTSTTNLKFAKTNPSDQNVGQRTSTKPATGGKLSVVYSNAGYKKPQQVVRIRPDRQKCYACGEYGHTTDSCRYLTRLCFYCREEGHIIRICPKRKRSRMENRKRNNGRYHATSRKYKRHSAASAPKKQPIRQYVDDLPPDVRREPWAPVGTIVTLRTIEDFANDDPLEKKSGCDDLIYIIMCCL